MGPRLFSSREAVEFRVQAAEQRVRDYAFIASGARFFESFVHHSLHLSTDARVHRGTHSSRHVEHGSFELPCQIPATTGSSQPNPPIRSPFNQDRKRADQCDGDVLRHKAKLDLQARSICGTHGRVDADTTAEQEGRRSGDSLGSVSRKDS